MNKSKESLIAVNGNSIFYKIKTFFRKLFFNNKNDEIEQKNQVAEIDISNNTNVKSTFLEDIKIQENKELKELLHLQKLFKMGRIKEKDLSKKERIKLEKLYKHQIYELNKSINGYKNKIISIRNKLTTNN
ncbi:MAG: hypothetical protein HFJ55_02980 [Clostridia bacterium]|nr:hypothetical protein [Clostridia bacterium]